MQEEILIKKYRSGTTIHYFNTDINPNNYTVTTTPAIVKLNSTDDVPIELHAFDGVSLTGNTSSILWKRNDVPHPVTQEIKMDFVYDTGWPNPNYISGRTFSETLNIPIGRVSKNSITQKFEDSMNRQFTAGTTSYVFFESKIMEDCYANIKLERSFDFLNTLSIYNKVSGDYTKRESDSGVVFGKLEAIQKINDLNGNKIRIPLRNVPVGIFVASDEFQTPNELDSSGNRIRLNYRPLDTSEDDYVIDYKENYFNEESIEFDNIFLTTSPLQGNNIHPTFKNVVYTNENGEFILHNIDVGPQILFFEVDLLKQGLTKDEVALNYFPYPSNYDNASVDTIPHYFYRAIPIDVVPSWGTSYQTGYTEVNVSANLDLRKWATYIIPPVTYNNMSIDSVDFYNAQSRIPLTVQIRDMSRFNEKKLSSSNSLDILETYPSKGIQLVEINNILDKKEDQQWEWASEFSQIKDKALFFTSGHHAIKLPANIYDDQSYKSDKYGIEQSNNPYLKGVWLCGYQLKFFLTKEDRFYRTTGMALSYKGASGQNKWFDRDHFHGSLYDDIEDLKNSNSANSYDAIAEGINLRKFPYERAWSKNYPEPYKRPQPPQIHRYSNFYTEHEYLESPEFSDGEYVYGSSWLISGKGWNGYGLSWYSFMEQYTDFATEVIAGGQNSKMYKYERVGAEPFGANKYFGCYANGFTDGMDNISSNVLNGERFQRVEAGYGYYLASSSLPRLAPTPSGLFGYIPSEVETSPSSGYVGRDELGFLNSSELSMGGWWNLTALEGHYSSYSVLRNGKSISIDLSKKDNINSLVNDRLNIYRIVDGKNRLSFGLGQPTIPTYTKFIIERGMFTVAGNGRINLYEAQINTDYYGTISNIFNNQSYFWLDIENDGETEQKLIITENGVTKNFQLQPGEKVRYYRGNSGTQSGFENIPTFLNDLEVLATGNYSYDENTNRYTKTRIKFTTSADWEGYSSGQKVINLHIRKDCSSETAELDALDFVGAANTWYADTVWKGIDVKYYKTDGNNGYPNDDNDRNWDGEFYTNIHGLFYNPGYYYIMKESANGETYSDGTAITTKRLLPGGSVAFYWSQTARSNPNGVQYNFTPLMRIGYGTNFNDFWSTYACQMKN